MVYQSSRLAFEVPRPCDGSKGVSRPALIHTEDFVKSVVNKFVSSSFWMHGVGLTTVVTTAVEVTGLLELRIQWL